MHERIGFIYIIVSAVSFGSLAIFFRLAYAAGADPTTILFVRCTIASFFCLGVLGARGRSLPHGRVLFALIGLGAGAYAMQSLTFFTALTLASASLVALVLYCYPAIVTILAIVVFRERPTTATIVALAALVLGETIGPLQIVGGALILAAVITLARQKANVTPPMLATKR